MPEFTIGQERLDFDQIREQLQSELRKYNSWNDIIDAGTGQMLIDFIAAIGTFNQQGINRVLQERFFDTQAIDTSTYRLSRSLGVHVLRKIPAKVQVQLTAQSSEPIPSYTLFKINEVDFFNRDAINFVNNRWVGNLHQGTLQTRSVFSNGQSYQRYQVGYNAFAVSDYYDDNIETDAYFCGCGDIWAQVGDNKFEQTRLGLWHYTTSDLVFYENTRADGLVDIQFGNNLYGAIPGNNGDKIDLFWIETLGQAGNNTKDGYQVSCPTFSSVDGITQSTIIEGQDELPTHFYKRFGADIYAARRRAVNRSDYHALISTYPGVIDVLVEGQQDIYERQTNRVSGVGISTNTDPNLEYFYVTDRTTAQIQVYSRQTKKRVHSLDIDLSDTNADLRGIWINDLGTQAKVVDAAAFRVRVINIDISDTSGMYKKEIVDEGYPLNPNNINPRDIHSNGVLDLVADNSGRVYQYGNATGEYISALPGAIEKIEITNGGSGYTEVPTVTVVDDNHGGSGAVVTALMGVNAIAAGNVGTNYAAATTTVTVSGGGATVQATVTPVISSGSITGFTINTPGSGYTSGPTVTIADTGSGSGASAGAVTFEVVGFNIIDPGSGYLSPQVVVDPLNGTQIGEIDTTPAGLTGVWFDDDPTRDKLILAFRGSRKLQAYTFSTKARDFSDTAPNVPLVASNMNPTAINADDPAFILVADDLFDGNQIYTYSWTTLAPQESEYLQLALAGENDIRWMNVVRIYLLTNNDWHDNNDKWASFVRWLKQRAIANVEYYKGTEQAINISIEATIYCFYWVDLQVAEQLIKQKLTDLFALRSGVMGRSYYLSNLVRFIENLENDQQRRIVDYLTLQVPTDDVIIQRHQYINLTQVNLYIRYTERKA